MRYKQFVINHYRAITGPLKIDVDKRTLTPIIGVNESGKTTILHAIFAFDYYNDGLNGGRRFQSPGLGRWLSPDPLGGDVTNPQSLNRYPYVLNNPTTFIDPLGLFMRVGDCSWYGTCMAGGGGWGSGNPLYQDEAAAEAQYMVQNNLCPGGCGGLSYTQGGLTYTWMAPAQTGVTLIGEGGVIIGTGSSDISPGYWAVGSVNDLGFFGQLNAYASDAFDALRN